LSYRDTFLKFQIIGFIRKYGVRNYQSNCKNGLCLARGKAKKAKIPGHVQDLILQELSYKEISFGLGIFNGNNHIGYVRIGRKLGLP
jgi:hypothetical protein